MEINELNEAKIPFVRINKKLNKFKGKVLFYKKLHQANELIQQAKLPAKLRVEESNK